MKIFLIFLFCGEEIQGGSLDKDGRRVRGRGSLKLMKVLFGIKTFTAEKITKEAINVLLKHPARKNAVLFLHNHAFFLTQQTAPANCSVFSLCFFPCSCPTNRCQNKGYQFK